MFYKVMKDGKVIDVLDKLVYLKYQPKHKIMVFCEEDDAQAILSSDNNTIWHEETLYKIPVDLGYDTVSVCEIDEYEYKRLKMYDCGTPTELVDNLILDLLNRGIL